MRRERGARGREASRWSQFLIPHTETPRSPTAGLVAVMNTVSRSDGVEPHGDRYGWPSLMRLA
jgi:hypothetical protein